MKRCSVGLMGTTFSVLVLAASPAEAQNLVQNGGFDRTISSWSSSTSEISWSSDDWNRQPGSGSLSLRHTGTTANGYASVGQCLPSQPGKGYSFVLRARIVEATGGARGGVEAGVHFFSGTDCRGWLAGSDNRWVELSSSWTGVAYPFLIFPSAVSVAPAGTRSVLVNVNAVKLTAAGALTFRIDDAYFAEAKPTVLTIPASASARGENDTFFQTDLWLGVASSRADVPVAVLGEHRCFPGQTCTGRTHYWTDVLPRSFTRTVDTVGTLFKDPSTSGAIELTYDASISTIAAMSRTYSPSLPAPTTGTAIPALPASEARTRSLLIGLSASGGDRSSGFRTNVGAYNPGNASAEVTVRLYDAAGRTIGSPIERTVGPREPMQINEVFGEAGVGHLLTNEAHAVVTSTRPVFAFATVIDNRSADSIYVPGAPDAP
ncbi:MAG TPA: hypothetical protein PLL76_14070 [Thermoanaerobaculia bacterium]|nr:hypothetical protein [Thermoanaerobaculia bacterium]HQP87376.1 hypothetical protein [Thermoanaerobaculia bacterium]